MDWPQDLISTIKELSVATPVTPSKSKFSFEVSDIAATDNWQILSDSGFCLGTALTQDSDSITRYGSEFKSHKLLRKIFHKHPLWKRLKLILKRGIKFPLEHTSIEIRKLDLASAIEFGNHKGIEKHPTIFTDLVNTDVQKGFALIIPFDKLTQLPGALLCPMNVIEQHTISDMGEIIDKQRACHDLSFPFPPSDTSVNSRVRKDDLQPCMFGHCIVRIIHYIIALRLNHPNMPILIQKIDFKSAYHRAHLNHETAIQCCSRYQQFALIPLRAVFGGSPCPSEWSIISECAADLSNIILNHDGWNPSDTRSPNQTKIAAPQLLDSSQPFEPALPTVVTITTEKHGKTDVYIDDLITITTATDDNIERTNCAAPLSIHVIGRPVDPKETIRRDDLLCFRKLQAEARLEETKVVLGWLINTRTLCISLPHHKFKAWTTQLMTIVRDGKTSRKELHSLLGRLTHLNTIIPHILHFLGRIRSLCISATRRRFVFLKRVHKEDLLLLNSFMSKAHKGINMNLLSFRRPTHVYCSDACPQGLGGFNNKGVAWRWQLPEDLRNKATINMLEHAASIVGPWFDLLTHNLPPLSCTLSLTDSTTSAGWLRRSNFKENDESDDHQLAKLTLSRSHAKRFLDHEVKEYSQWFPGHENVIADSLSRDFHLSSNTLTLLLHSKFPTQLPPHFKIHPLPQEIVSWLSAWLRQMPELKQSPEQHQMSNLARGNVGFPSSSQSISKTIHSYESSTDSTEFSSCLRSPTPSELQNIQNEGFHRWLKARSVVPWTMYHRPIGITNLKTQDSTPTINLHCFYNDSMQAIKARTRLHNTKKHSQH